MALQALCSDYAYKTIKVFTDNSTTLAYVNNKGSRKSNLNDITRLIWLWALDNHVWIEAWFIPGKENVLADTESRRIRQVEWKLNVKVFNKLQEIRGPFLLDLFASRISHQLPTYISWLPDPEAWKTNAFSINWDLEGIYCFPPLCLIARILHRGDSPAVKDKQSLCHCGNREFSIHFS